MITKFANKLEKDLEHNKNVKFWAKKGRDINSDEIL